MRATMFSVLLGAASVAAVMVPQSAMAQTRTSADTVGASKLVVVGDDRRPGHGGPGGFVNCPPGTQPTPFDMPIYDDEGLFVVGYKTVWFCLPDDLEPAG